MKATISLDGLLAFILSLALSASNKQWLGEKLLEEARLEKTEKSHSYAEFIESLCGAWKNAPRSADKITAELRAMRQFNHTRQIMPLSDKK